MLLGDMGRFAVDVGEQTGHELRRVDLWAAGQWLTCDDNMVYVPQFRHEVARTADWVRSGRAEPLPFKGLSPQDTHRQLLNRISNLEDDYFQFRPFDRWGPTTDNVHSFAFRDGDRLALTFELWRERDARGSWPRRAGTGGRTGRGGTHGYSRSTGGGTRPGWQQNLRPERRQRRSSLGARIGHEVSAPDPPIGMHPGQLAYLGRGARYGLICASAAVAAS